MLATAYLLAGASTPESDILPIQVGGGGGTDLSSVKCPTSNLVRVYSTLTTILKNGEIVIRMLRSVTLTKL
jgi:hypothetical protein